MTTSDDPDMILKAAAEGAYDAFERLVKLLDQRLKAACKRACWPPVDYEDVAQIVWIEAYEKLAVFDNAEGLRKWLINTAQRRAIDEWRKLKNLPGGSDAVAEASDSSEDGLEAMINQERIQVLQNCLDGENPAIKVLLLKHLDGLSYDEIANMLDIKPGTIASRISRGRDAIEKCMEGKQS